MNSDRGGLQIDHATHGTTVILRIRGAATADVAEGMNRALWKAVRETEGLVAVDLSELSFISSSGLSGLVAAHNHCTTSASTLAVVNPSAVVREILSLTRLDTLFHVADTLDEAEQFHAR